jgi:hypothetical protein
MTAGKEDKMPIHDWTRVGHGTIHHFHHLWVGEISKALNSGILPPDYYAYAEQIAGDFGPDVLTLQEAAAGRGGETHGAPTGAVALAEAPPQVRLTMDLELSRYTRRQRGVVLRHSSGDRVIAIIEVVSPGNKASRNNFRTFIEKACAALNHGIHLLLLDLLPPTPRDPQGIHGALLEELEGAPYSAPPDKPLTLAAYAAGTVTRAYVEPAAGGDPLPDMPLFLDPEYYVKAPLEATYQAAWLGVPRGDRRVLERPS